MEYLAGIRSWFDIGEDHTITHIGFRSHLSGVLMLLLVLLAVAFASWSYWREKRLPRALRGLLAFFRGVVYLALLWIIFGPFISLERSVEIKRDVLVLLDRSKSMAIQDKRSDPQSLGDAALALGKADYQYPAEHEALLSAQGAIRKSCEALAGPDREVILKAMLEVKNSFEAILRVRKTAVNPTAETMGKTVQILGGEQEELMNSLVKLPESGAFRVSRQNDLAAAQKVIGEKINALIDSIRSHPVDVSALDRGRLAAASRMDLAAGLLTQQDRRVIRRLAEANHVRGFVFGEKLQPVGSGVEAVVKGLSEAQPLDESTRGGEALAEVVAKYGGQYPAGIVMLTDGAFNQGADAVDVARRMKDLGIPLFTVGLGLQAPQDIVVGPIIVPEVVFPKDKVSARVRIFSSGYRGKSVDVRLLLDEKEMAVKPIELTDKGVFVDLPFVVPENMAGTCKMAVLVDPQPDEQTHDNNRSERSIKVIGEKIKVLYVEGMPRWEYRYLKVVLQRDKRLDVKFLLTQGDKELAATSSEYLAGYPDNPEEEFKFDLVILGDVPSSYFDRPQMERMVRHVRERGASLLMLAGEQHAPASYAGTPIDGVLPVRIRQGAPELVSEERHPSLTAVGRRSFAGFDASNATTDSLWSLVKPLYSLPALDGAKPAANVLLEIANPAGGNGHPLVAWHYAGTGKVMFIGTDQLWRLRMMRGDEYHALFWSKGIQFLALSRLLGENKQIRLETDGEEFRTGDQVEIHANVLDGSFQPTGAGEYAVKIERLSSSGAGGAEGSQTVTLMPVTGTPGLFHGIVRMEKEGRYQLKTREEDKDISNVVDLVVAKMNLEMLEPAMQASRLREIAELSGGRHLTIRDWPALPGLLARDNGSVMQKLDMDIWDTWQVYLLVVICAGMEWFLRRRYHLV